MHSHMPEYMGTNSQIYLTILYGYAEMQSQSHILEYMRMHSHIPEYIIKNS